MLPCESRALAAHPTGASDLSRRSFNRSSAERFTSAGRLPELATRCPALGSSHRSAIRAVQAFCPQTQFARWLPPTGFLWTGPEHLVVPNVLSSATDVALWCLLKIGLRSGPRSPPEARRLSFDLMGVSPTGAKHLSDVGMRSQRRKVIYERSTDDT